MDKINKKDQLKYYKFLNSLPKKINKLYFGKLIGKFKSPNKIHFLSELPKGPSGKIQRFKIQDKIKWKSF